MISALCDLSIPPYKHIHSLGNASFLYVFQNVSAFSMKMFKMFLINTIVFHLKINRKMHQTLNSSNNKKTEKHILNIPIL